MNYLKRCQRALEFPASWPQQNLLTRHRLHEAGLAMVVHDGAQLSPDYPLFAPTSVAGENYGWPAHTLIVTKEDADRGAYGDRL